MLWISLDQKRCWWFVFLFESRFFIEVIFLNIYLISGLVYDLKQHLFGQHIVQQIVPSAIAASIGRRYPTKPLVMSFHGWPGSGKNYVAAFVVKNFFKKGLDSSFFHFFSAPLHFPLQKDVALYQVRKLFSSMIFCVPLSINSLNLPGPVKNMDFG